jgi:ABC-2 type transport system permease protein
MLKRELKINFKSFLIWTGLLILLFLATFLVYPSIIKSDNIQMIDEMMKMFPEEILKAFNMDLSSIDTAYGWLKTEGFVFILLLIGIYSSILGSNILLKEENDKTIEYLNTLPIRRESILLQKVICAIIYIISMIVILAIFNYICLDLSGDFDKKQYILLSLTPLLSSLPLFSLNLFISTFTHKSKKILGVSLGIVLVSYFLQIISEMNEVTEFFKYFTVYTLADVRSVITTMSINPVMIIISFTLTILFLVLSIINYNKKELIG